MTPLRIIRDEEPEEEPDFSGVKFDGEGVTPDMVPALTDQLQRMYDLMKDGRWYTPKEISEACNLFANSVMAQLQNFRKEKTGAYLVTKRKRASGPQDGMYEYQLGPRGAHIHKPSPQTLRAEAAERQVEILREALREFAPHHFALTEIDKDSL